MVIRRKMPQRTGSKDSVDAHPTESPAKRPLRKDKPEPEPAVAHEARSRKRGSARASNPLTQRNEKTRSHPATRAAQARSKLNSNNNNNDDEDDDDVAHDYVPSVARTRSKGKIEKKSQQHIVERQQQRQRQQQQQQQHRCRSLNEEKSNSSSVSSSPHFSPPLKRARRLEDQFPMIIECWQ
ncbi:hypothetical protein GGR50DRAFT_115644 [Xylaria sp. CBS 124048]|nr:hypothetical protein GGR50DRAFT_115644 [Xylaria sp. CBS 124048]